MLPLHANWHYIFFKRKMSNVKVPVQVILMQCIWLTKKKTAYTCKPYANIQPYLLAISTISTQVSPELNPKICSNVYNHERCVMKVDDRE